jgi:hypothetical protein
MSYFGTCYPPVPIGQAMSFYYLQRQRTRTARPLTTELTVEAIARVDNLAAAFDMMRQNGQAPGPDGLKYPHVGRRELFDILRPVSRAILDGTYRPGPARQVHPAADR